MAFAPVFNHNLIDASAAQEFIREFNLLRAELNDIRTKYAATLAKLDLDVGVTDVNYASLGALTAVQFVA